MRSWRKHFVFLSVYLTGSGSLADSLNTFIIQWVFLFCKCSVMFALRCADSQQNLLTGYSSFIACQPVINAARISTT